ncbi:GGDEF domain-containing protein [Herbaspirillum rubrisubalbicans]|uniref:diguanylate cyclase n=1 Tax=Herbaspirillum rubrisubalbicans TaxID=80842 RepID=A0AAD0U5R7_9BURK|nr:GGDEF domain-containing protein [Herbaspirillum rubrisubalbicans]ALU87919.1 diguanylate cyclase GGDEF family protein [Herbaspirillum rubrisubalbicans M1]AYR22961.1 diguanylate cyclase [Herbaspirillum rubrisubalbicans]
MNLLSKNSLAVHLLRIIFGSYFLVTLIVTCLQLGAEYEHTQSGVDNELRAMEQTFGASLASSTWRFQGDVQKATLRGISNLPVVTGVKIEDPQGRLVMALGNIIEQDGSHIHVDSDGARSALQPGFFDAATSHRFPILYRDEHGVTHDIGAWTVYSSRHVVIKKVAYGFTLILINSIIKTLVLWFIFLYVFNRWLGQPIAQLADFVSGQNLSQPDASQHPQSPQSIYLPGKQRHELHFLAEAINAMLSNLRKRAAQNRALYAQLEQEKESLRLLNKSLELRIAERTHDLAQANERLRSLSLTDGLTGIANRRSFDETLDQEWRRSVRHARPLTVAFIDVDWFKPYNDHYGHVAGDAVLRQVAQTLQETIGRAGETVARYGGEEFAVIVSDTDGQHGLQIVQRMCDAIYALDLPHAGSLLGRLTISCGVASCIPAHPEARLETLMQAADAALYQAKTAGRNRVLMAPPVSPPPAPSE